MRAKERGSQLCHRRHSARVTHKILASILFATVLVGMVTVPGLLQTNRMGDNDGPDGLRYCLLEWLGLQQQQHLRGSRSWASYGCGSPDHQRDPGQH